MLRYFPIDNNSNKLFQDIGNAIKEFYPLGLERESAAYAKYPGILKLEDKINYQMLSYNKHIKPWKEFLRSLPKGYKSKIKDNTIPFEVSYSGVLIIDEFENENIFATKKLVFNVSTLSYFYTIYGVDETVVKDKERPEMYGYSAINVITESPYSEFEEAFNYLQTNIRAQFTGYQFVPIRISLMYVKGLQTINLVFRESRIHDALFNGYFSFQDINHFRGEMYYGSDNGNIEVVLSSPKRP